MPAKVIIDTDPGCDDVLAMLLAFASDPEDIEVLLISATYGNVDVQNCLRNVVSMFHVLEKEMEWRKQRGLPPGFESLRKRKPIVAIGPDRPLVDTLRMADYFHGRDGLGDVHETHKHLSPPETWKHLFEAPPTFDVLTTSATPATTDSPPTTEHLFTPSTTPSHLEILRLLRENPEDTITLIGIGPMTTYAHCAATDPQTFIRAKELLIMGGSVTKPGNITPLAEFNTYADATAAARVYALTSPIPISTMPIPPPNAANMQHLPNYPSAKELGERRLKIVLFPLDITHQHMMRRGNFNGVLKEYLDKGSPLAEWMKVFIDAIFNTMESLNVGHVGDNTGMELHDPMCVWYALNSYRRGVSSGVEAQGKWSLQKAVDLRVETAGQWSMGACIVDRRDRKRVAEAVQLGEATGVLESPEGDTGGWLSEMRGNRIDICVGSPGASTFGDLILKTIFGSLSG